MASTIQRPGLGLPLSAYIHATAAQGQFPPAVADDQEEEQWKSNSVPTRERAMLWFISEITDKPDWHTKVHDDAIVAKWKAELAGFVEQGKDAVPLNRGFSDAMFDYALAELRDKAKVFESAGAVSVIDCAGTAIKSDTAVSEELRAQLIAAVKPLEDVPEAEKDWHPGSNGQVLDLVHPSLFPLVYGRTRVLDCEVTLADALALVGAGDVVPVPEGQEPAPEPKKYTPWTLNRLISYKYQWLPAEVDFGTGSARFASYINNLHPEQNKPLYGVLEKLVDAAVPLWGAAYNRVMGWDEVADADEMARTRVPALASDRSCTVPDICGNYCSGYNRPNRTDNDENGWTLDQEWFASTHSYAQPEPKEYSYLGLTADDLKPEPPLHAHANNKMPGRLQVIVKLANIHLTPENPSYPGGTWHSEGQMNERIAATALYYYDCENVTTSRLAFRAVCDREEMCANYQYDQGEFEGFKQHYDVNPDDFVEKDQLNGKLIELGDVVTREGRLLVFPNVYQHRVGSFELADKTKPGHRKIVALFLVDPATPVVSTANVPPQQLHWRDAGLGDLPPELTQQIYKDVGCPYGWDEAVKFREELMDERRALDAAADDQLRLGNWSFCEH
ncbi:uncharacterized protein LOC62_05G006723 [Vanrija pseudolonga]|uniref:Uncharacterized protein n=1 Tax=Vanrija pseudolonga TaxID=143232 RepID=A0AAF0YAT0_9TREE|nr:hypothetical protein LOC62_05G006723 [Vanrija pseudolonga]